MYWASRRVSERRNLPFKDETKAAANAALDVAAGKVSRLVTDYPDYFPLYTDHGRWKHGKEAWTNWCEGFLGGQMWLFHELGLGEEWQARAEHTASWSRNVSTTTRSTIWVCAVPHLEEMVGTDRRRRPPPGRHSGRQDHGHAVQHQGQVPALVPGADSNFIDIMMNVGIIAVAGLETGDHGLASCC